MFGTYCYAVRPILFYQMRCVNREVWGGNLAFCVFTGIVFSVGPPGGVILRFSFLPAAFGNWRPPVAPSFVARRKIGEKGVPKGSKAALWNLAFNTGVRRGDVRTLLRVRPGAINAI